MTVYTKSITVELLVCNDIKHSCILSVDFSLYIISIRRADDQSPMNFQCQGGMNKRLPKLIVFGLGAGSWCKNSEFVHARVYMEIIHFPLPFVHYLSFGIRSLIPFCF